MKFQFKCEQCGKEIEVVVKLVAANQVVELPKELEAATIQVKCPTCGHSGKVSLRHGAEKRPQSVHELSRATPSNHAEMTLQQCPQPRDPICHRRWKVLPGK